MLSSLRIAFPRTLATRQFTSSATLQKTIYVGNLSWNTKDEDLKAIFEEFGAVSSSRVVLDRLSGRSRGFGFVDLAEDSAADVAVEEYDQANRVLIAG